jgi:hypothetical protein
MNKLNTIGNKSIFSVDTSNRPKYKKQLIKDQKDIYNYPLNQYRLIFPVIIQNPIEE